MALLDLIVVGSGIYGLIAAHTWLELHPNDDVMIIEAGPDLGGVWSKSRVYSSMMTQSPENMFHYACYPMPPCPRSETYYDMFPGSYVGQYLEAFSDHKRFVGKTIRDRIIFHSPVKHISKVEGNWRIEVSKTAYTCKKLIVATGVTSTPTPLIVKQVNFDRPIIHTRELAENEPVLASPKIKHVVVLGGAKSSFDAVQLLYSLGKRVTWIIRKDGQGPGHLSTPSAPWPFAHSHQIVSMKLVSKMSPCIFEPLDFWTRFYHSNRFGIWLVDTIYAQVNKFWSAATGHVKGESLKSLHPDRPMFYSSDNIGVLNSKDMLKKLTEATILRDDVESLSDNQVVLTSGDSIPCDAVIAAIGWSNVYPFFDTSLAKKLGLPLLRKDCDTTMNAEWENRISVADKRVVETFPRLANPPSYADHSAKSTPSRLYRAMVPIDDDDRSVIFLGAVSTIQSFATAEVQALWAAAYLGGKMELPGKEEMRDDVALATAWRRRRYLGDGYSFLFDQIEYVGMLLRDLGINDQRKGGGFREILCAYETKDYEGIVDEWKAVHDQKI